MKNALLVGLCILLAINICIQGINLYHWYVQRKASAISVKAGTTLNLANHAILGSSQAAKIVIEFGDYECPFCFRFAKETLPSLRQMYIDKGIIRYAYMNWPLPMHANAKPLAIAAECAGLQNKYWAMHDVLIEKRPTNQSDVLEVAKSIGLVMVEFESCLSTGATEAQINNDIKQAKSLGVVGTPAFAVGVLRLNGQVLVQKIIGGAKPLETFQQAIENIHME